LKKRISELISVEEFKSWFPGRLESGKTIILSQETNESIKAAFIEKLKILLSLAHSDAKNHFLELHASNGNTEIHDPFANYPGNLPDKTLKGYLGETFAGIVAELQRPYGKSWCVPAFLFRYHNTAFELLERMYQGAATKEIPGRTGDDCLAFEEVGDSFENILLCEAKFRSKYDSTLIDNVEKKLTGEVSTDVARIREILKSRDDEQGKKWYLAVTQFQKKKFSAQNYRPLYLISILYDSPHKRQAASKKKTTNFSPIEKYQLHLQEWGDVQSLYGSLCIDLGESSEAVEIIENVAAVEMSFLEKQEVENISPVLAMLYSQSTLISQRKAGLSRWESNHVEYENIFLTLAVTLIDHSLNLKQGNLGQWQAGLRRAAEILEWLSNTADANQSIVRFLAAATYLSGGYYARAQGILLEKQSDQESEILFELLRGDFKKLQKLWVATAMGLIPSEDLDSDDLTGKYISNFVFNRTFYAIGELCVYMRWGEGDAGRIKKYMQDVSTVMIYGASSFSWLLARLTCEVVNTFLNESLRERTKILQAKNAENSWPSIIENYNRISFYNGQALTWPSQVQGIERVLEGGSFAMCAPTGAGKTRIAEMVLLRKLFGPDRDPGRDLVLYVVPSKALAAEVEGKFERISRKLTAKSFKVTGLYGGIDWGPTDQWAYTNGNTMLISTYEKAEALIRFLGDTLINRIAAVVVDEAHFISYDGATVSSDNRHLRLESMVSRMFARLRDKCTFVMLSAMASGSEDALAKLASGDENATPVISEYSSTRQVIGRLIANKTGYKLEYDYLEGKEIPLEDERQPPYVPDPFPKYPSLDESPFSGVENRMYPHIVWSALNFTVSGNRDTSVMIFVSEVVERYAKAFLDILVQWNDEILTYDFRIPSQGKDRELWDACLISCEDYFGRDSYEYRLMSHGIVLHHGKMPGLLSRLLVRLIERRIVRIVLATATLSDGVNLPFETILIPKITRGFGSNIRPISPRDFGNLAGRAGRPGNGPEGRCLVLMDDSLRTSTLKKERWLYSEIMSNYKQLNRSIFSSSEVTVKSPIGTLLTRIRSIWKRLSGSDSDLEFEKWLEKTADGTVHAESGSTEILEEIKTELADNIDTLDGILVAAIAEMDDENASASDIEERLRGVWKSAYTHWIVGENEKFAGYFVRRGVGISQSIFVDSSERKRIYKTSLPPRRARVLFEKKNEILDHLRTGIDYLFWDSERKFKYIEGAIGLLRQVPDFQTKESLQIGRGKIPWHVVLKWWLAPVLSEKKPSVGSISKWYSFISKEFLYKFNWGLGSVIGLAAADISGKEELNDIQSGFENIAFDLLSQDAWLLLDLPFIVYWLKELTTWGTLDPLSACLLSSGVYYSRKDAEAAAQEYYQEHKEITGDKIFDPDQIKTWLQKLKSKEKYSEPTSFNFEHLVVNDQPQEQIRVLPCINSEKINWVSDSGSIVASSPLMPGWNEEMFFSYDFFLSPDGKLNVTKYI
jgi:hypothetical protein